jgi:FixJ family two-component response regulator
MENLYESLLKRKEAGERLIFKDISDEELYILYFIDDCSNRKIAELFDINPKRVSYRRQKIGATFNKKVICQALNDEALLEYVYDILKS